VFDLFTQDFRNISQFFNAIVGWIQFVYRHRKDLFVGPMLVLHEQRSHRTASNHRARHHRNLRPHHRVAGVAIFGECVGNEAVVGRIVHGGVKEAIYEHRTRNFVELGLDRNAAFRNLEHNVNFVGRVRPWGILYTSIRRHLQNKLQSIEHGTVHPASRER